MLNQIIVVIAALIIVFIVIGWILKIIKLSVTTALTVFVIILILKFGFGIESAMVWEAIINLPKTIQIIFNNN
jgi:hypothetical protein